MKTVIFIVVCLIGTSILLLLKICSGPDSFVYEYENYEITQVNELFYTSDGFSDSPHIWPNYVDASMSDERFVKLINIIEYEDITARDEFEIIERENLPYIYQYCLVYFEDQYNEIHKLLLYDFRGYNDMFAIVPQLGTRENVFWVTSDDEFCNYFFELTREDYKDYIDKE